jgi:hypothetical protein
MSGEGLKYDTGKLRWDLLPIECIEDIVKILTFGADKYGPNNWQDVTPFEERYYAALMRHIVAWRKGEKIDPESGMSHLAHALCNVVFLDWNDKKIENGNKGQSTPQLQIEFKEDRKS